MKFGVVILGAGASRRMGRPKLLLPWSGTTIVGHLLRQWNELGATQIAIVLSVENVALKSELDRLQFPEENRVINPRPERGMFSSIQCAANWTGWNKSLTHIAITLGDQPHLKQETLRPLIEFSAGKKNKICQPSLNGRPKHPVVFPRAKFDELRANKFETLAHLLETNADDRAFIEVADLGLDLDLDTPSDFERARTKFSNADE